MKLICKANTFELPSGLFGMGSKTTKLPLTIGQDYEVQITQVVNTDGWAGIGDSNWAIEMRPELIIYTDNKRWEKISLKNVKVPYELEQLDDLNKLLTTLFQEIKNEKPATRV